MSIKIVVDALIIFCCFLIGLFLILATSCGQQQHIPGVGNMVGPQWNRANASTGAYFDEPQLRTENEIYSDPSEEPPVYLTEPCATWLNASEGQRDSARARTELGYNVCAFCHCAVGIETYHSIPIFACRNASGAFVGYTTWLRNPDNQVIRWRSE